jgi:hypothetical protein
LGVVFAACCVAGCARSSRTGGGQPDGSQASSSQLAATRAQASPATGPASAPLTPFVLDYRCDEEGARLIVHRVVIDTGAGTIDVTNDSRVQHGPLSAEDWSPLASLLDSAEFAAFTKKMPAQPLQGGEGTYCSLHLTAPGRQTNLAWSSYDARSFSPPTQHTLRDLNSILATLETRAPASGPASAPTTAGPTRH